MPTSSTVSPLSLRARVGETLSTSARTARQARVLVDDPDLRREAVRVAGYRLTALIGGQSHSAPHPDEPLPLITHAALVRRMLSFTHDRLAVDWRSGPPYELSPEVDMVRGTPE